MFTIHPTCLLSDKFLIFFSNLTMESNFIKERTVIREKIINKNLEKSRRDIHKASSSRQELYENPPKQVIIFEEFVNEKLKQDLVDISKQVDKICQTIADYLKVKAALNIFKKNPRDLRLQTNIGCNFYAQCHVDDASKVFLCVGQDIFLEMEIGEAIKMIDFKEAQWNTQLDLLQERASKIKAYIKLSLETMDRMYEKVPAK